MRSSHRRQSFRALLGSQARILSIWFMAILGVGLAIGRHAAGQEEGPPHLSVALFIPSGVRTTATESWGTFDFEVTNRTEQDRLVRVLVSYKGWPDVRYGRDLWVPARSTVSSWMLVGSAAKQKSASVRDIELLLYDRTSGKNMVVLPRGEERLRSRAIPYAKREPTTAIYLDEEPVDQPAYGQLPQPESMPDEALRFARTIRHACRLSEVVLSVNPDTLPPTAEGFAGVDYFILASNRIAQDPAGMQALRRWLQRGGRVWIMLDRVDAETIAPLLGDALDFDIVDRVSLTAFQLKRNPPAKGVPGPRPQQHERPVDFARVLLPPHEHVLHTVNGWPAWFTRQVGRGKVIVSTLGPRGWFRDRLPSEPSPYPQNYPKLPVPTEPLEEMVTAFQPPPKEVPFRTEAFDPSLKEEIGYTIASQGTVAAIFAAFLLAAIAVGLVLRTARRRELLGWLGPVAAIGAAVTLFFCGDSSTDAVPTVAVGQVVDAVSGTEEVAIDGRLAMFQPSSGTVEAGVEKGGLFELDMSGLEGKTRRFILTDMGGWHWEGLAFPKGVRFAPFRATATTDEPITAALRFVSQGVEGKLHTGPFQNPSDALLSLGGDRKLAIRLSADGTFRAAADSVLPGKQFLASAVLTDRQQRRQELYRQFLKRPEPEHIRSRNVLLAWADPLDTRFALVKGARKVGDALLIVPLRLERPAPGARITIPGPFLAYRRVMDRGMAPATLESINATDMQLRFQLPREVLPFKIERAKLVVKINAPSRVVTLSGHENGKVVKGEGIKSPLDPVVAEFKDERLLRLDEHGGLHLNVAIGESLKGGAKKDASASADEKWIIEYIELEVTGQVSN